MKTIKEIIILLASIELTLFLFLPLETHGDEENPPCGAGGVNFDKAWPDVRTFMSKCNYGFHTEDGCKLTIEKACINGVAVDMIDNSPHAVAAFSSSTLPHLRGLNPVGSRGLSAADFTSQDQEKMYTPVNLPSREGGTRPTQLCHKIEGAGMNDPATVAKLSELKLPRGSYVESVPDFIKPGSESGGTSLHWSYEVKKDGSREACLELRYFDSSDSLLVLRNYYDDNDKNAVVNPNTTRFSKACAPDFDQAYRKIFVLKDVVCKKNETFDKELIPESDWKYFRTFLHLKDYPDEDRREMANKHQVLMDALAPTGLNTGALTANFRRILAGLPPERPAPPLMEASPGPSPGRTLPRDLKSNKQQPATSSVFPRESEQSKVR